MENVTGCLDSDDIKFAGMVSNCRLEYTTVESLKSVMFSRQSEPLPQHPYFGKKPLHCGQVAGGTDEDPAQNHEKAFAPAGRVMFFVTNVTCWPAYGYA